MELLIIFVAGYFSVAALGFQSRNVNHGNFKMAAFMSFLIAQMQTTLWGQLFSNLTWEASVAYGLSGAAGITSSMWLHQRFFTKADQSGKPR